MLTFISCKKRDKLIYRIISENEGKKIVQYVCLESKTGQKYIQEYIGDTLLESKYYINAKNEPEGKFIYFDKSGNIEQTYYINSYGNIDGLLTFYYPSGKISELHYYNNGIKGLQEYYLENGFLKCVYYFENEKMHHKKNIILENGEIKDTVEELYPIIKFEKDTVSVGEEFSVWIKRPKSKYINDKSHWGMVYDLQNISKSKKYVEPDEELILDTIFEERRGKLTQRGKYVFYYDIYKDSIFLNSNSRDYIYVR